MKSPALAVTDAIPHRASRRVEKLQLLDAGVVACDQASRRCRADIGRSGSGRDRPDGWRLLRRCDAVADAGRHHGPAIAAAGDQFAAFAATSQ